VTRILEPAGPAPGDAFRQRWPWLGPDLQTVRDTLRPPALPPDQGRPLPIPVGGDQALLAMADQPVGIEPRGLVLLLPGLGGSSGGDGLRRLALTLQAAGLAVWRLNLRGAGSGRAHAAGTYAARCDADLLPVLQRARAAAAGRPLLGVGLSLGGTMLLNACLGSAGLLDGLVCLSSPLDLEASAASIERPRNRLYQRWLLRRLRAQTLADPFGVTAAERLALEGGQRVRTIRAFDAAITAPRWGYASVGHYYREASPLLRLRRSGAALPPSLLLHALDDPWVPAAATASLAAEPPPGMAVVLSRHGGHNGFHGAGDGPLRCWSDQLTLDWLEDLLG
jgi:hypothetical protein